MALKNVEVLVPLDKFQDFFHGQAVWTRLPDEQPLNPGDRIYWILGQFAGFAEIVEINGDEGRCKVRKLT